MRFTTGNEIRYGQDSDQHVGIPVNIEFVIERLNNEMYRLTADGYGEMSKGHQVYGNGPLYVWGLDKDQERLFDEVAIESQSTQLPQDEIP